MNDFRRIAKKLRPGHCATQDDLTQEMALTVLRCKEAHTLAYFRSRATWRAQDYLRRYGDLARGSLEERERRTGDSEEDVYDRIVLQALGLAE